MAGKQKKPDVAPLGDKIVVKRDKADKASKGGILLPDQAQKKPTEGVVVAVGPGRVLDDGSRNKLFLKVGDKVLFSKYAGTEVLLDGEDYDILEEDQVYAVVNP